MKPKLQGAVLCMAIALCMASAAQAQEPSKADLASAKGSGSAVEPQAMDALNRMGKALRGMKQFSVQAVGTDELVTEDGQKLQFGGTVQYKVMPPKGLYAEVKTDRKDRQYFYNGKTATIYAPKPKYFATFKAPGNVQELVRNLESYGVEFPLADLFRWGTKEAPTNVITSAYFVGPAFIDGTSVAQYAYRQPGADWQVWLDGNALPRKLVITDTTQPERPEYSATLTWNSSPGLSAKDFAFTPPDGAYEIEFIPVAAAVAVPVQGGQP